MQMRNYTIQIKFIQCKYEIIQNEWKLYNTNRKIYNINRKLYNINGGLYNTHKKLYNTNKKLYNINKKDQILQRLTCHNHPLLYKYKLTFIFDLLKPDLCDKNNLQVN